MSIPANSPIILPIATIQPTFQTVISEVDSGVIPFDTFWISCYRTSSPSIHDKVHASLDEIDRDLVILQPVDGNVQITRRRDGNYTVACPPLNIPHTQIVLPKQEYADPDRSNPQHPHRITAFDIAPDGSQFATGFLDGSVHIYPNAPFPSRLPLIKTTSKGHLSTVTSIRFFPSSRVILSSGSDFSLSIIPADLPSEPSAGHNQTPIHVSPVRTLRAHTRTITSTGIIARGRNVLSASSDGTVRLWDVGGGRQIYTFVSGKGKYTPVTAISLGEKGEAELGRQRPDGEEIESTMDADQLEDSRKQTAGAPDEREVETQDKVVFCALQDGSFEAFDLGSKRSLYQSVLPTTNSPRHSPLSAIAYSPSHNLLATGSRHGVINLYDTRSLSSPVTSFLRNSAAIEDIAFTSVGKNASHTEGVGLVVATEDGLPYIASVQPEGPSVLGELISGDCDGVRVAKVDAKGDVWTASDDGIVRKFSHW